MDMDFLIALRFPAEINCDKTVVGIFNASRNIKWGNGWILHLKYFLVMLSKDEKKRENNKWKVFARCIKKNIRGEAIQKPPQNEVTLNGKSLQSRLPQW